jgi:hypothetical protein
VARLAALRCRLFQGLSAANSGVLAALQVQVAVPTTGRGSARRFPLTGSWEVPILADLFVFSGHDDEIDTLGSALWITRTRLGADP